MEACIQMIRDPTFKGFGAWDNEAERPDQDMALANRLDPNLEVE